MDTDQKYPKLFSAVDIGNLRLRNRIIHASMTTRYAEDGDVSQRLHNYYLNRALGGAALLVSEPINGHRGQTNPKKLDVYGGKSDLKLGRLVETLAKESCFFVAQIQDSGRGRREAGRNDYAVGPSPLPDDISWTVPRELGVAEIERLVDDFVLSCKKLKSLGIAGVEISAGHGHLFHQFLSAWSNHRCDDYGGGIVGRTKLLRDLILSIRDACGDDFLLGLKLPGDDGVDGSIDENMALSIAVEMGKLPIDYWTFAWGTHANSLYQHLPDAHGERTPYAQAIRKLRKAAPDIPTGALAYLTDPNEAERLLTDGTADLVMMGRALITDPAWPNKARHSREAEIRYCVSCNTCWRTIVEGDGLQCDNNPRVGMNEEADWKPKKANIPRKVVVVGGGIAGMEAAWVLGLRGHDVTVFNASGEVGGKTRIHACLPGGENLSSIYDYQYLRAQEAGVNFEFDLRATVDLVHGRGPDAVILASGSRMSWPSFLDEEDRDGVLDLRTFCASWVKQLQPQTGRLLIYDKDHTEMTYAAAEYFADYFSSVVIVTPRERIASDVSLVNRQGIYQRLYDKRVTIISSVEPQPDSELEQGRLTLANVYNGDQTVVDGLAAITYATPRLSTVELLLPLQKLGIAVHTIGDCHAPRSVLAATREGHQIGLTL